jgi:hypothetical protein
MEGLNILLSIIIMATKSMRNLQLPLRSSPRNPNPRTLLLPPPPTAPACLDSEDSHNQHSLLPTYDEFRLRIEKESTSPPTHAVAPLLPHHS